MRYVIRGDEGVYMESLLLMQRGYLPFRDFFFAFCTTRGLRIS